MKNIEFCRIEEKWKIKLVEEMYNRAIVTDEEGDQVLDVDIATKSKE